MKASALKSVAVIGMADRVQIGVEDILFDTTHLRVAALVLATSGTQSVLPFSSVHRIGADAVTVEAASAAQLVAPTSAGNALRHLSDMIGLKLVNGEDTHLGDVREVHIDEPHATKADVPQPTNGSTIRSPGTDSSWRLI